MKAYHLNGQAGAGRLVRADVSRPTPASGEVRIRVEAASLNYRDLLILDAAGAGGLDGRVPLCDGAGIVDAIGADVSRWRVGDRVAASYFRDWLSGPFRASYIPSALGSRTLDGMLAEYVVLPATALVSVPEHLTSVEAATLPCAGVTTWHGLMTRGGGQGRHAANPRHRRRCAVRPSVRRRAGDARDCHILVEPETRPGQGARGLGSHQLPRQA